MLSGGIFSGCVAVFFCVYGSAHSRLKRSVFVQIRRRIVFFDIGEH